MELVYKLLNLSRSESRFVSINSLDKKNLRKCIKLAWREGLNPKISKLYINKNAVEQQSMCQIMLLFGLKCRFITDISVCQHNFGDKAVSFLTAADWKFLRKICLSGNNIGINGAQSLSTSQWDYLKYLDLSSNRIKNGGFAMLMKGNWGKLQRLAVEKNQLTTDGLRCLRKAQWLKLNHLNILGNHVGSNLISELAFCFFPELSVILANVGDGQYLNINQFSKLDAVYRKTDFYFQPSISVRFQKKSFQNIFKYFELVQASNEIEG